MKMRRARAQGSKEKVVLSLYNKMSELVSNLAELLSVQVLTDSTVLLVSFCRLLLLDVKIKRELSCKVLARDPFTRLYDGQN